ncbi:putative ribonuclease p/mrp protein subunit pop5 [Quercus suber]|uniref:Ribonuclease p/mrp protein subunit pop5 n=1 Tax=Quercus suber TaxID=58331 RepID=A0AAW0IPA5_QUESU
MNPITKLCIIRASREEYQKVWSAITMVRSIGNCPVLFNLLDLSDANLILCTAIRNFFLKIYQIFSSIKMEYNTIFSFLLGSIKACRNYDELKFEQYKLVVGACLANDAIQHMQNCLDKIKVLEH